MVCSLLQTRILRLRLLNSIGCVVLIVYNGVLGVWPMVGLNLVLVGINAWFLRKLIATRHDTRTYSVVEVGDDSEMLAYVLEQHSNDIATFNPGFTKRSPGRVGFLVLSGDEVVGIVLVRDLGRGTGQVELDYVTPRFRDFTPGEFVYRRSPVFAAHGFTKIVTPKGMVSPYYGRIGFRRAGDTYVLDTVSDTNTPRGGAAA